MATRRLPGRDPTLAALTKVKRVTAACRKGLPPTRDLSLLNALATPEPQRVYGVAEDLGVSPQTLATSLSRLEEQELVTRWHEGRTAYACLTPEGWAAVISAADWQAQAVGMARRVLSAGDRAALRPLVEALRKVL